MTIFVNNNKLEKIISKTKGQEWTKYTHSIFYIVYCLPDYFINFPDFIKNKKKLKYKSYFRLLVKDPRRRLGGGEGDAEELKRHPFFQVNILFLFNWNAKGYIKV